MHCQQRAIILEIDNRIFVELDDGSGQTPSKSGFFHGNAPTNVRPNSLDSIRRRKLSHIGIVTVEFTTSLPGGFTLANYFHRLGYHLVWVPV